MKKYSPAPKDIADAIKDALPVSEKEALGEDWKKLPPAKGRKSLSSRRGRSISVSTETVFHNPTRKGKANSFRRVKVGDFRLEVPESAGIAYTDALIDLLKNFIKRHPLKA